MEGFVSHLSEMAKGITVNQLAIFSLLAFWVWRKTKMPKVVDLGNGKTQIQQKGPRDPWFDSSQRARLTMIGAIAMALLTALGMAGSFWG